MKVHIENNAGAIRVRFQTNGVRYSFCPYKGARHENRHDRLKTEAISKRIEADVMLGVFDTTLNSYKGEPQIRAEERDIAHEYSYSLREVWVKYREYKVKQGLAPSTIKVDFDRRIGNLLPKLPTEDLSQAVEIRNWISANTTLKEASRIFTQLNACCKWAVECSLIPNNPFEKLKSSFNNKKKPDSSKSIDPFTIEERDQIIHAFRTSKKYSYYAPLVTFLFYTGCRPNEAVALRIQDVDFDKRELTFCYTFTEKVLNKGLKTEASRTIILSNTALEAIRESISQNRKSNTHGLVFPAPKGDYINWNNFCNRGWRKTLESLKGVKYKNPYQTRHTFITLLIQAGETPQDIAKYCGNSTDIIFTNYAGHTRAYMPPDILALDGNTKPVSPS